MPTTYMISSLKSPWLEVEYAKAPLCKIKGRSLQPPNSKKVPREKKYALDEMEEDRPDNVVFVWRELLQPPKAPQKYWFLVRTWVRTVIQDGCLGNHACPSRPNIGPL